MSYIFNGKAYVFINLESSEIEKRIEYRLSGFSEGIDNIPYTR